MNARKISLGNANFFIINFIKIYMCKIVYNIKTVEDKLIKLSENVGVSIFYCCAKFHCILSMVAMDFYIYIINELQTRFSRIDSFQQADT